MIIESGKIGAKVMMDFCQRVLNGREIPDEWKTSMIVPVLKKRMI